MAQNYIQCGDTIDYLIPASTTIVTGQVVRIGVGIAGVALSGGTTGDKIAIAREGVFSVPKLTTTGELFAIGAQVFYDTSTNKATTVNTSPNCFIGCAVEAAVLSDTEVKVVLIPIGARV